MRHPIALAFLFFLTPAAFGAGDTTLEFFESKIRPVLVEHCYKCHAADAKNVRGGLLLDSRAGTLAGGESGEAVVPGKPEASLLIAALKHESYEMPPDQKLPDAIINDFEKWIRDGAADPRTGGQTLTRDSVDMEEGRKFWSFRPFNRGPTPDAGSNWAKSDIDRFVAKQIEVNGLAPAADATPNQILRRLYFGLIGLPPLPDDIRSFEAAWARNPDDAIAETADRLLNSPRYGERWGRHWLDVARFAESSGGGRSLMFPAAWRFRDYVIRSFNNDKPFDQLIREHIAGDLLEYQTDEQHDDQVTGVGYLALGPTNYEQQDKELLRMEVVDEQIDTLGRTFLGLTLGCARCHDHKFDPVPTADYYALAGIFRSTKTLVPGNVSSYVTTSLKSGSDAAAVASWNAELEAMKTQIAQLKAKLGQSAGSNLTGVLPNSIPGIVVDDVDAEFVGEWIPSTSVPIYVGQGYRHDDQKRSGRRVEFSTTLTESGMYRVRFAYSPAANRSLAVPVVIHHVGGPTTRVIDQRKRPDVDGLFTELGIFEFDSKTPAVVTVNTQDAGAGVVIVDAVQFLSANVSETVPQQSSDAEANRKLSQDLKTLEAKLKAHEKQKPEQQVAMSVRDEDVTEDWHIHVRGGIRNLGPLVSRGIVTVAGKFDENGAAISVKLTDGESGRRELADWMASPENPLTARVFVNRVWQHLTGEGLVRTPDNFGKMGQRPTHPELLDYLAARFVDEDHWSVKKLIRRIVTAHIYRISSGTNAADPDNLLLTRGVRRRLEAEALRDAVLQISGQLDLTSVGGRTIKKLSEYDNGYNHDQHVDRMRSVYVPFFRNSMLEFFEVFDIANSNLVTGRRAVSTLPAQGLYLLNSPFVLEQSQLAAEHFLATESDDLLAVRDMMEQACLKVLGRMPNQKESQILTDFVSRPDIDRNAAWASVFQALFASVDFRYVD